MNQYYDRFCKLCDELAIKNRIDPILAELYTKRDALQAISNELKSSMVREQADVERLNEVNVTSIFYTVIGQKDKKLEKEKAEAFDAEEKFADIQNQLAELDEKIKKYERELRTVRGCDLRYGRLLPQILDEIKAIDSPAAKAVLDTFDSLTRIEAKLAALDEALELSRDALKNARDAAQYIDKADHYSKTEKVHFLSDHNDSYNDIQKFINLENAAPIAQELTAQVKRLDTGLVGELLEFELNIEIPFTEMLRDGFGVNNYLRNQINEWKIEIDCLVPKLESIYEKLIPARNRWAKRIYELRIELQEQIKSVLE